ncbi:MAG: NAD-dependent epimerase/dehydratase family protein [Flavobacteriaceae bacterium]
MKVLLTGAAGFIGFYVAQALLQQGVEVVGIDDLNDYYDPQLKRDRLGELGVFDQPFESGKYYSGVYGFSFALVRLEIQEQINAVFAQHQFDAVCHLAAQAGVRYSLENPMAYAQSNLVGFLHILEACRHNHIHHLVYASSSSVYGMSDQVPFTTEARVDQPISLYAATKKSNELMAYTYAHLFGLYTTGLRFFTVYGPWGRPDMAPMLFAKAIKHQQPIKVFNHGVMERDFTYVVDIAQGVCATLIKNPVDVPQRDKYALYNIGNNQPVSLLEFIELLETEMNQKAIKNCLPMQPGDVVRTWADTKPLMNDYQYQPSTPLSYGIGEFVRWYQIYTQKNNNL